MANIPYAAGVPKSLTDTINNAGGDAMDAGRFGSSAMAKQTKTGVVSVTSAKTTESATASFTIVGVLAQGAVGNNVVNTQWVATTADATATTVTFTRTSSTAADVITYIFFSA